MIPAGNDSAGHQNEPSLQRPNAPTFKLQRLSQQQYKEHLYDPPERTVSGERVKAPSLVKPPLLASIDEAAASPRGSSHLDPEEQHDSKSGPTPSVTHTPEQAIDSSQPIPAPSHNSRSTSRGCYPLLTSGDRVTSELQLELEKLRIAPTPSHGLSESQNPQPSPFTSSPFSSSGSSSSSSASADPALFTYAEYRPPMHQHKDYESGTLRNSATMSFCHTDTMATGTFEYAVKEGAFYRELEGFTDAVLDQATAAGWTLKQGFVQQVLLRNDSLLRIEEVPSASNEPRYRWLYRRDTSLEFITVFPPQGDEKALTEGFTDFINLFLHQARKAAVNDRQRASEDDRLASPPAFWETAVELTRFLKWEDRPLSYEEGIMSRPAPKHGVSPLLGRTKPGIVVVPTYIFERVARRKALEDALEQLKTAAVADKAARASQVKELKKRLAEPDVRQGIRHDEAIIIEAKVDSSKKDHSHATNSSLFKTSQIKDVTLSNGDLWFATLLRANLYLGWFNAGLIVQYGPINAEQDPVGFLQAVVMLASKGATLNTQTRQSAADADAAAATTAPTLDPSQLLRPWLKKGGTLEFTSREGRLSKFHVTSDLSGKDVRCWGASRGADYRAVGKHTDVFVADGRLTEVVECASGPETAEVLAPGRYVLKTSSPRDPREPDIVESLEALKLPPTVRERLPRILASGYMSVNRGDPVSATLCHALDSGALYDQDTADALHEVRQLFLTVYQDETFALHSLPLWQLLAVISDAVFMVAVMWYKAGFIHRDISDSNIAAKYSAEDLHARATSVEHLLQRRLEILERCKSSPTTETQWWEQFIQDDLPLCVFIDLENACHNTSEKQGAPTKQDECNAIFSGTPIYGAHIDWSAREKGTILFAHHAADDGESLAYVTVSLLALLERRRLQDKRNGWVQRSAEDIRNIVTGPSEDFREALEDKDLLGPQHPLLGMLEQWRQAHEDFYGKRYGERRKVNAQASTFAERRQAMFVHPPIVEGAAELFREIALLTTRAALDALRAARAQADEGP